MSESEKTIGEIKQSRIEKLIEKKVENKTKELQKQNEKLRKEIQKLKTNSNIIKTSKTQNNCISRREFLKKAGLGSVGLAALSLAPASALNINTDELSVNTGSDTGSLEENLLVNTDGGVEIPNGDLRLGTGQAIEDGSGQTRLNIDDNRTRVLAPDGQNALSIHQGAEIIQITSNQNYNFRIHDEDENSFTALEYETSEASPGTFELTNAELFDPREQGYYLNKNLDWPLETSTQYLILGKADTESVRVNGKILGHRSTASNHTAVMNLDIQYSRGADAELAFSARSMYSNAFNSVSFRFVELTFEGESWHALEVNVGSQYSQPHRAYFIGQFTDHDGLFTVDSESVSEVTDLEEDDTEKSSIDLLAIGLNMNGNKVRNIQNGESSDLAVEFNGGAGIYIDENGDVVAVDESGNETTLT